MILLFSDLHNEPSRVEEKTNVLTQIRTLCFERKIKTVFFLGDMFDTRGRIPTVVLSSMVKEFRKWQEMGLRLYLLVGNHDLADRIGEVHALESFKEFPNIKVIDESAVVKIDGVKYGFIPYVEDLKKELEESDWYSDEVDYLLGHAGIEGAMMNSAIKDIESNVNEKSFSFVKSKVFMGHYHMRSTYGKVQYVGSPIQQKIDEAGQEKGVIILDDKTGNTEFIALNTPRYIEYTIDTDEIKKLNKKDFNKHKEIDHVRIHAKGEFKSYSRLNYSELEGTCKSLKVEWIPTNTQKVTRIAIKSDDTRVNIIHKYVNFLVSDVEKANRLKKLGGELYDKRCAL